MDVALQEKYRVETRRLVARRGPLGAILFAAGVGIAGILEYLYHPRRLFFLLLFFGLELAVCAVTIACYRNRRLRQFRVGLTRSACLGLLLCVTLYAVAVGADHAEFALLFIVFELTTALMFPWGAYNQALMGAACMISFAAFVAVRGVGDPALPVAYELYAVGAGALISVLGAAFLDRQRFALFAQREQLDQHLATFRELTHAFRGFDPQLVVFLACTSTLRSFGLERSWVVWRTVEDGSHGYLVRRDEDGDTAWDPLIDAGPLWTWVAGWRASDRAFLADDTDQQMPVSLRGARVGSLLCVPLQFEGEHLGAICADRGGRPFVIGEGELALASVVAGGAAIALANARLYQQVTAANEEKSVLLARIAHELRNPLQAILWDVDALQDGAAAESRVERVRQNALMTLDLAKALQDFAEVETMQLVASPEPVNVAETLDNLQAAAMSLIEGRPITFRTRVSADARVLVTDPFRLRQVLGNLISNAAKFTARGSIEVEADRAGSEIAIAVRDSGVGIEESESARIFAPFYRGSARALARTRGMGLGLAIARDLTTLLGGRIEVESAVGQGSTFRLFLPDGAAGLPAVALDESPIAGSRVLLIEDDARCRARVAEALRQDGSTVIEAGEGLEGLSTAREQRPDVIVLDLGLPGLSGADVLDYLKADPALATIPVIVATADRDAQLEARCRKTGCAAYVAKPYTPEQLLRVIAPLTGRAAGVGSSVSNQGERSPQSRERLEV